jgi:N-acetyl-anhydromuramyl-L-alanine amidase AmpD
LNIAKLLTKYNLKNDNRTKDDIQYIVIHYIGGLAGAKNNAEYWASKYVGSSAHYIIGHKGEIYQSVLDEDIAWHCGAVKYKHPKCRNANSIGIEMCVRKTNTKHISASDKDWYFEDATVDATVKLTKELMKKYDIPVENVLMHYHVTGKQCPAPYVHNPKLWDAFKTRLVDKKYTQTTTTTTNTTDDIQFKYHIVKSGEVLSRIAAKYHLKLSEILDLNDNIKNPNNISIGQKIIIGKYKLYKVVSGDSLIKISNKLLGDGSRYKEIMEYNNLENSTINVGQILKVPVK